MSDVDFEPPTPFRENNCSPQLYRLRAFHEEKNNFKKQRKNSTAEDPFNLTPEQVFKVKRVSKRYEIAIVRFLVF